MWAEWPVEVRVLFGALHMTGPGIPRARYFLRMKIRGIEYLSLALVAAVVVYALAIGKLGWAIAFGTALGWQVLSYRRGASVTLQEAVTSGRWIWWIGLSFSACLITGLILATTPISDDDVFPIAIAAGVATYALLTVYAPPRPAAAAEDSKPQ